MKELKIDVAVFQSVPAVADLQQAGGADRAAAADLCGGCAVVDGEAGQHPGENRHRQGPARRARGHLIRGLAALPRPELPRGYVSQLQALHVSRYFSLLAT